MLKPSLMILTRKSSLRATRRKKSLMISHHAPAWQSNSTAPMTQIGRYQGPN